MDYQKISSVFRQLALEAGDAIMQIYGEDDFAVSLKADASPVTAADEAADRIISAGLRQKFPDLKLVTEEQSESHKISGKTFLIVDPLDGTKEFVQRRGDFTVNIALVEDGIPTRGVVYSPARQRLFWTDENGVSHEEFAPFVQESVGKARRIHVREANNAALTVVASKSHRDQATDDYIALYDAADFISAGSSLKFCLVAAGEADLYPRLGRTMEWDTAAGQAVLSGAGGTTQRFDNHEMLDYGKAGYENPFFIACAPTVKLRKP